LNKANFIQVEDVPIFNLSRFGLTVEQKFVKRVFDVVLSSIGLIIAMPILIIVATVIKLTDSGPIFFRQERLTVGNKRFNVYKFRTMVMNAEEMTGPVLATAKDPRITKIGHFLRSTRLDEVPQLLNVFNGSMSIVGPRPERDFFVKQFIETTPSFEYRTAVKAGITGLAQVLGKYTTSFEDKLRYDLMYIKNYTFLLDIKIIIKTLKVILTKDASAGSDEEIDFDAYLKKKALNRVMTSYGCIITSLNASVLEKETGKNEAVG
ncbi:sugar transferase, partial [Petrocella sp. FN5]|uniref:sugar transferase n=1 Tax=Petrocella sp. FN5 TaxID=3032002 RepID=UPI0023DBD247